MSADRFSGGGSAGGGEGAGACATQSPHHHQEAGGRRCSGSGEEDAASAAANAKRHKGPNKVTEEDPRAPSSSSGSATIKSSSTTIAEAQQAAAAAAAAAMALAASTSTTTTSSSSGEASSSSTAALQFLSFRPTAATAAAAALAAQFVSTASTGLLATSPPQPPTPAAPIAPPSGTAAAPSTSSAGGVASPSISGTKCRRVGGSRRSRSPNHRGPGSSAKKIKKMRTPISTPGSTNKPSPFTWSSGGGSRGGKRRGSLVRRTHSPKNTPSPLSSPVNPTKIFSVTSSSGGKFSSTAIYRPSAVTASSSSTATATVTTTTLDSGKARRRNGSPHQKGGGSSPPSKKQKTGRISPLVDSNDSSTPSSSLSLPEVRTISPTVRGIAESARVLLRSCCGGGTDPHFRNNNNTQDGTNGRRRAGATMLSFPTETVYALGCCVPVATKRRGKASPPSSPISRASGINPESLLSTDDYTSLETLLRLKGMNKKTSSQAEGGMDPPCVYLHDSTQAEQYVHFSKPKTYILKPTEEADKDSVKPTTEQEDNRNASPLKPPGRLNGETVHEGKKKKLRAVTFSESWEVFHRLADAFWPGPVVICARVRRRTEAVMTADEGEGMRSPSSSRGSSGDENDVVVEKGGDDGGGGGGGGAERSIKTKDLRVDTPVLPASLLWKPAGINGKDAADSDESYVGLRCPSHPLARRILTEVYGGALKTDQAAPTSAASPSKKATKARNVAVIGFTAALPSTAKVRDLGKEKKLNGARHCFDRDPTTAREVCTQLLSEARVPSSPATSVYVLKGEDKREIFSVPTCQYGMACPVSLLVDDESRKVRIIRHQALSGTHCDSQKVENKVGTRQDHENITASAVQRALFRSGRDKNIKECVDCGGPRAKLSGSCNRVVAAVLRRWEVTEDSTDKLGL